MIRELTTLANHLDSKGLRKEADYLDRIISKVAEIDEDERSLLDALEDLLYTRGQYPNKTKDLRDCMEGKISDPLDHDERRHADMYLEAHRSCLKELYGSEEDVLSSWLAIVKKIEDRMEEIGLEHGGIKTEEGDGWTSISVVPIRDSEKESRLRGILKNDFDWPQEKIDEYQNQRPSRKRYDDDSQWQTPSYQQGGNYEY